MLTYTRNMQKAIYALIADLSESDAFNCSPPVAEALLKKEYWGDREGVMSLALDKCTPNTARGFYRFLLEVALANGIQFCTWTSKDCPPRSPLAWGFENSDLVELCISFNINPYNLVEMEDFNNVR